MKTFMQYLDLMEGASRTAGKTGLYPLGYAGVIGNYPPAYMINTSADALYYMDQDERFYLGLDGPPFNINHIHSPHAVIPPKEHGIPGKEIKPKNISNKEIKPKGHGMPGKEIKPKGTPMKCLVAKPTAIHPASVPPDTEDSICPNLWKMPAANGKFV